MGKIHLFWEELITVKSIDYLDEMEIFFIKKFKSFESGYNMTPGGDGGDTISIKTALEKKNQGVKLGNVPWNKGVVMKDLGYSFEDRTPRNNFTDEDKKNHSFKIKNSEKYQVGLLNRVHGKSKKVLRISDEKTWPTIKDCSIEINVSKSIVRRHIYGGKLINGEEYIFVK